MPYDTTRHPRRLSPSTIKAIEAKHDAKETRAKALSALERACSELHSDVELGDAVKSLAKKLKALGLKLTVQGRPKKGA